MKKLTAIKQFNYWVGRCWENESLKQFMRHKQQEELMGLIDELIDKLPKNYKFEKGA